MEKTTAAARNGAPWATIMIVALIIAKLGFGVNISWLWVFAPFWLPILLLVGVLLTIGAVYLIAVFVVWAIKSLADLGRRRRFA